MKRIAAMVGVLVGCAHAPVENTVSQEVATALADVAYASSPSDLQSDWAAIAQITAPASHSAPRVADQTEMLVLLRDVEMELDAEPVRNRLTPLPAVAL